MKMKKWFKCLLMSMVFMMAVTAGTAATAVPVAAKTAVTVKVGKTFTSGKFKYKITSLKGKKGTATLTGMKSKSVTSVTIPKTVKAGKYTLTVNAIGKNAFANCRKLKKVVTNNAIKEIGSNAFSGCTKLTTLNIKSSVLKSVGKNAMAGISAKAVVSVPKGKGVSYGNLLKVTVKDPSATVSAPVTASKTATTAGVEQNAPVGQSTTATAPVGQGATVAAPEKATAVAEKSTADAVQSAANTVPEKETCGKKHLGLKVVESVAPTCTETGLSSYQYCTVCGYKTTPVTISALGHNMVKHPEVPATCTATGRTAYESCTRCGYATPWSEIPKTAHDLTEVAGKEATCTAMGWKPYEVCRKCGYETPIQYLNALGHEYGDWTVVEEATCTETGREERVCSRCQNKVTRTIAAKGHHRGAEVWTLVDGSCYEKLTYPCTDCDYVERTHTVRHSNAYMEKLPDEAPTCTKDGSKDRSRCSICGQMLFNRVPKLGHSFTGSNKVTVEPTCTNTGAVYEKCDRCDEKKLVEVLPAAGSHTWVDASKAATCTEKGFSGKKCSACGATEGNVTPATGHQYVVTEKPATCDNSGEHTETCKKCGKTTKQTIQALGHNFTKEVKVEPTCTEDGAVYKKCSRCDEKQLVQTLKSDGRHSWADATTYVLGSPAAVGVAENTECRMSRFVKCTKCNLYEVVPGYGHVEGENCAYGRAKAQNKAYTYIQWTVFLSETGWSHVDMGGQCSTLMMDGKKYASYIPTMRSVVNFNAPVPNCPAGKKFVGWQQVVANGDNVVKYGSEKPTDATFDDAEAGKTYVAVFR